MKLLKQKNFYKFLIPSLIGAFLFVTPINQDGNLTIPVAVAANALLNLMGDAMLTIIWALICTSALLTIVHKTIGIGLFKSNPKLDNLFGIQGFWYGTALAGCIPIFIGLVYLISGKWKTRKHLIRD